MWETQQTFEVFFRTPTLSVEEGKIRSLLNFVFGFLQLIFFFRKLGATMEITIAFAVAIVMLLKTKKIGQHFFIRETHRERKEDNRINKIG